MFYGMSAEYVRSNNLKCFVGRWPHLSLAMSNVSDMCHMNSLLQWFHNKKFNLQWKKFSNPCERGEYFIKPIQIPLKNLLYTFLDGWCIFCQTYYDRLVSTY